MLGPLTKPRDEAWHWWGTVSWDFLWGGRKVPGAGDRQGGTDIHQSRDLRTGTPAQERRCPGGHSSAPGTRGNPQKSHPRGPEDAGLTGNLQKQPRTWVPSGPRVSPSPQRRLGRDPSGPVDPTVPALCCPTLCLPGGSSGQGCDGDTAGLVLGFPVRTPTPPRRAGPAQDGPGLPLLPPPAPAQGKPPEPVFEPKKKKKIPAQGCKASCFQKETTQAFFMRPFPFPGKKGRIQGNSCSSRTE